MLRGRFSGFGTAAAGFGAPISLRGFSGTTQDLGAHIMAQIGAVVPVLAVNLIAAALQRGPRSESDLLAIARALTDDLTGAGAVLKLPSQDRLLIEGLRPLTARGIVAADFSIPQPALLAFYAAPLAHFLPNAATPQT